MSRSVGGILPTASLSFSLLSSVDSNLFLFAHSPQFETEALDVCANCFFSSFLSFLADFNHIPEVFFFYLFFAETSYCAPESFFWCFQG